MARYINLDKLIEGLRETIKDKNPDELAYTVFNLFIERLEKEPIRDVVPKSEVEELEAECERQYEQAKADILANMADSGTSCHWCIDTHKAQAKAEVAREIFEEIEEFMIDDTLYKMPSKVMLSCKFAELKKKYIGEQNDERKRD